MIHPARRLSACVAAALLVIGMGAERALACAVCFGDPSSDMAKGAVAGVMTLLGIISFVLMGVAGTGLYWVRRGRRIDAEAKTPPSDDENAR